MIYDTLENAGLYRGMSKWLDKAIDVLETEDFAALEPGTYTVDGDNVYYMVQTPALKPAPDTKWEVHRRYIDIQVGLADGEGIGYAPMADVADWEAYNEQKDVVLSFNGEMGVMLPLRKGTFAILFPLDGHRPCVKLGGVEQGHKVVFKVRVE